MTTAAGVVAESGTGPRSSLHSLEVKPVSFNIAKAVLVPNHYLKSMPGGNRLTLGVFDRGRLKGALALGAGPTMDHREDGL